MLIRPINIDDWNSIYKIQTQNYPVNLYESLDILKSKEAICPTCCFVAVNAQNKVLGYCLSHYYVREKIPKFNKPLKNIHHCNHLFIHDMAVSINHKRTGIGKEMFKHLEILALNSFDKISLVAVDGADSFWLSQGFNVNTTIKPEKQYGKHAVYMEKALLK